MKKNYESLHLEKCFQKGILAASIIGAAFISGNLHAQAPTYCASVPYTDFGTDIYQVSFASMTNVTTCTSVAGPGSIRGNNGCKYSNYTTPTVPTTSIVTGVNYALSVTVGDCNNNTNSGYVGVWIDWNQDGLFTGTGEQVYQSTSTSWSPSGTAVGPLMGITVPTTAVAGVTRMRVVASEYYNVVPCRSNTYQYDQGETEDYSIYVSIASPCNSTPAGSSVVAPSGSLCAGSQVFLTTAPSNTNSGVSYSWQASTSNSVGPYTNVSSGNNSTYLTNVSTTTWYRLAYECPGNGSTVAATPAQVLVASTVTNSIPYFEGFEEPQIQQGLGPNCSWSVSLPGYCQYGSTAYYNSLSPYNGNGMAFWGQTQYVYGGGSQSFYFYTNGIQMNAGVTYSASLFYSGYDFVVSMSYGTSQNPSGLTTIATSPQSSSQSYKHLADTFRVPASGIYYVAIQGTTPYIYEYTTFDDLSITAPCFYPNNAAKTALTGTNTVCLGKSIILTATGASSYTWSPGGATTNTISVSPNNATAYSVSGMTNTSNCVLTQTTYVFVEPVPGVQILPSVSSMCVGQTATLIAIGSGAQSFTWSTGDSGPAAYTTTISPNQTTTYNLVGINSYGCTTSVSQVITVNQPPAITVNGGLSQVNICAGEPGTLLAGGANTYTWSSPTSYLQSNPISPYPTVSTSYTVSGIDNNGCPGSTTVDLTVNTCTGIKTNSGGITNLQVYPNPTSGVFTIALNNGLVKNIDVMDVTGRVILSNTSENDQVNVNINNLSNGIYYVRVKSDNATEVLKVVKQ